MAGPPNPHPLRTAPKERRSRRCRGNIIETGTEPRRLAVEYAIFRRFFGADLDARWRKVVDSKSYNCAIEGGFL
jgi:hypothetical protein